MLAEENVPSKTKLSAARGMISSLFHNLSALVGIVILVALVLFIIVGQFATPYSPTHSFAGLPNSPPSNSHPFGTDFVGHDVFSQVVYGAFPTFYVSVIAAVVSVLIGFFAGIFSGYFGKLEGAIGGATDVFLAFPILPLLILVGELYVATELLVALFLSILLWPPLSRAVRAQVASLKQRPYVEAAKTSGIGDLRIIWTIIVPQVFFLGVAYLIINTSVSIIVVTAVEFLGVGNPNAVNLGSILYWAQQYAFTAGDWWWFVAPGALIALFSVSLSLVGFSMENLLNPRMRR